MRRAKIVATIGPASESPERLRELITAGVDVVRINMSHGEREHHAEVMRRAQEAAAEVGRPLATLVDLGGPKIRTGKLVGGGPVELVSGSIIRIVSEPVEGTAEVISTSYPPLPEEVQPGGRILIDDGLIELQVESLKSGEVTARVVDGGLLHERKGLNLPGAALTLPSLTEKDREDLITALDAGADFIALSFVRKAEDVEQAYALIQKRHSEAKMIAKIEKPEAMDNLDAIIDASDGVMVARGDLGVETSAECVPVYQKRIIAKAVAARKVVITATQMLQSMVDNPRPTRAEASDVANAILDGTDAVMLSGETAVGKFPVHAVQTMDRIIQFTEKSEGVDNRFLDQFVKQHTGDIGRAIAEAAVFAAREIGAEKIVIFSESGGLPRHLAALRPPQQIIVLTAQGTAFRQLAAVWGIQPLRVDFGWSSDSLLRQGDRALLKDGIAREGEMIVYLSGHLPRMPFSTSMKLHTVGDFI